MYMFNRQINIVCEMISKLRNHLDDAIEPLQPLQVKLDNLHSLFMAYKPVFSSAMSILQMQPSFDRKPIPPLGRKKRSLLPFLGLALKWLTGTVTTKDIKHIKKQISSLIKTQENQWKTMVHIVSILNLTHYETQVNRQWINIILKELTKSNKDIRALFNITNQLATGTSTEHCAPSTSNAHQLKRLFAFYEATSKPRTGIYRHCHHRHPNTTSDTCTQPTEDAVPNRIRTTY